MPQLIAFTQINSDDLVEYVNSIVTNYRADLYVATTGAQEIEGQKTFNSSTTFNDEVFFNQSTYYTTIRSIDNDAIISMTDCYISNNIGESVIDWNNRQLQGEWTTEGTTPVSDNGIITKAYVDNNFPQFNNNNIWGANNRFVGTTNFVGDTTIEGNISAYSIANENNSSAIDLSFSSLKNSLGVATLNWDSKLLSGDWITNTNPTNSGSLVNKWYVDSGNNKLVNNYATQNISGLKTFANNTTFNGNVYLNLIYTTGGVLKLDLNNQGLSGKWTYTGVPTSSTDLVNKLYVDGLTGLVRTTGTQTIEGLKDFLGPVKIAALNTNTIYTNGGGVNVIDVSGGNLLVGANSKLNWVAGQLTGNWLTNGVPTNPLHLVNKAYVDSGNPLMVQTTGNQNISGNKTINGHLIFAAGANSLIYSSSSFQKIDVNSGQLFYGNGAGVSVDWNSFKLNNSSNATTINWDSNTLSGNPWTFQNVPKISSCDFVVTTGNQNIDGRKTFTSTGYFPGLADYPNSQGKINLQNGLLQYTSSVRLDWINRSLSGSWFLNGTVSSDPTAIVNKGYVDSYYISRTGSQSVSGQKGFVNDTFFNTIWVNQFIGNDFNNSTTNVTLARLTDNLGSISLNWNNRQLSGVWTAQSLRVGNSGTATTTRIIGRAVLVGGTKTVSEVNVTTGSNIFLTSNVDGGTPGWLRVSARVAGTSFTITSSSASDTSTVSYEIVN